MSLVIPNYRILEQVGTGAGSVLYRVKNQRTGDEYTLKYVKLNTPEDQQFVEQLKDELAVGSRLQHDALRKVYDLQYLRRRLRVRAAMLFMEYVDGIPMNDPEFDRSLEDILELFAKAAEGFGAMHSAGFVHADIKPGNMLVTKDNKVKIIDYGQALGMREAKDRIQGTMDYIAPEQVRKKNLDQRTDVYGLGAALHRVITGKPIATDMNQNVDMDTMRHLGKRRDEITAPDLDDLPTPVVRLIENCTHTDPRERLKDMRAMAERTRLVREVLLRKKKADEEEERRHAAGNTASPALVDSDRPPDQSKNA